MQRKRPLISLAAVLAFIPRRHSVFWGGDGLHADRRHRDWDDLAVSPGALCRLVQDSRAANALAADRASPRKQRRFKLIHGPQTITLTACHTRQSAGKVI